MPSKPMPFPIQFADDDEYIESMLSFITSSELFQHLCGGVHILEFITQEPDLYTALLPHDWRRFFESHDVSGILDLLMREDLSAFEMSKCAAEPAWHSSNGIEPPVPLLQYISNIRKHSLGRNFHSSQAASSSESGVALTKHVAVGMNAKKVHEVSNLAKYVDNLSSELSSNYPYQISHIVDFGSGQNYLGRALASAPYNKRVIALESKPLNINGARSMDVTAKLAKKEVIIRNKKEHRSKICGNHFTPKSIKPTPTPTSSIESLASNFEQFRQNQESNIQYIETTIADGDLSSVISQKDQSSYSCNPPSFTADSPNLIVISLHSCGNLLHHGLRSLVLNTSVRAVALVGCCYNLLTERLPPIQESSSSHFRAPNVRLTKTSSTCDPHGFPMSEKFISYKHSQGTGVRFNITARMMAVQAPENWTQADCSSFFTRHFYRALFQRILLDKGVIDSPNTVHSEDIKGKRSSEARGDEKKTPIILGSLRKSAYISFLAYVRAAITKLLSSASTHSSLISQYLSDLTDEEILSYEKKYAHKKKELSIVWSFMAFSAQVVESAIVVDRWLWLREQEMVKEAWVENVFEYGISPRNLVVVGVKG
ncbi:MAG: hypothetical protein Q9166_005905 [cf. Caloplaca sp. 2 TL-2023]